MSGAKDKAKVNGSGSVINRKNAGNELSKVIKDKSQLHPLVILINGFTCI